jgi:hypothetical protein
MCYLAQVLHNTCDLNHYWNWCATFAVATASFVKRVCDKTCLEVMRYSRMLLIFWKTLK